MGRCRVGYRMDWRCTEVKRRSGPGSDMPARTPEQDLAVVVGCTARIVVVEPDTTEHTTVQASGSSLLPPFPGSTPQMDEATQPVSQKAQMAVREVRVLCLAVDVDCHQRTAVDHVHPLDPKPHRCYPPKGG